VTVLVPGLCSVTLRALDVDAVVRCAADAGLTAIEWGGDVHVPPGDQAAVARATHASAAAGITCASYGSYLLADGDASPATTARVLDTAVALGVPGVRMWTPFGVDPGSARTGAVVDALAGVAVAAAERRLGVALEFHGGTLTATVESTLALLDAVGAPNLTTYWQSPYWLPRRPAGVDAADVARLGSRLSHVHVYEWSGPDDRRPLADGAARWPSVFDALRTVDPTRDTRVAFLEFVAGDDPDALARDARTLHDLLGVAA
jgi:sugar phosphate isomerase/epimerase